jgi:hypothetical protein
VPVETRGKYLQSIKETKVADNDWLRKHFQTIVHNYGKAPYFEEMHQWLTNLYMPRQYSTISEWNHHFITKICELLGIKTRISFSYEYSFTGGKTQKLLQICNQAKASVYVTGPRAKNYLDLALMNSHGVEVRFFKYENYPTYSQLWGEFEHKVSIVDLILNCGTNIQKFMRSLS